MTGRKTKPQEPRVRKSEPATRTARQANKRGGTDEKRVAAAVTKKSETDQASRKAAPRAQAAAPLLARTARKIGAVDKAPSGKIPQVDASYQPKTAPPATPVHHHPVAPHPAVHLVAMAHPWMTLGWRMTAAGLALHARMAKAALDMPPATAMRQGAEAMNAWFSLMQSRPPKTRKD
jgi:hypothetical protein